MAGTQYDQRTQRIGNKMLLFATLNDETGEYDNLEVITGMNTAEPDVPDAEDPIRRDNQVHIQPPTTDPTTIEFAVSQLPDKFREMHLGQSKLNGAWVSGVGKKLPFYLVYFSDLMLENGGKSMTAEMYPKATVVSDNIAESKTDEERDYGFTVRVDASEKVMIDGVMIDHMEAAANDPEGKLVIQQLLDGKVFIPGEGGNTTTTTTTLPTTTTTTSSTTTTTTTEAPSR